jgi:hypothetical protein
MILSRSANPGLLVLPHRRDTALASFRLFALYTGRYPHQFLAPLLLRGVLISKSNSSSIMRLEGASSPAFRQLTHTHQLALMSPRSALPARYPPIGVWPALMRADMAAAYLDYRNTAELARAVTRGEAPPPTGYHGTGRSREPVWSKAIIDSFTGTAKAMDHIGSESKDLASLV